MMYKTITDNLDGTYTLDSVYRAIFDTGIADHTVGDRVWFFDGQENFFDGSVPLDDISSIYFLDNTVAGQSSEADATIIGINPFDRLRAPLPPDYVEIDAARTLDQIKAEGAMVAVTWRERNRLFVDQITFENDATQTQEAGVLYDVSLTVEGIVEYSAIDIAGTSHIIDTTGIKPGVATVFVTARKDGLGSFSAAIQRFNIEPSDGSLTIDYDLVEEDGEGIAAS